MKTNIGLTEKDSFGSAELLNKLLSDLSVKTRNYQDGFPPFWWLSRASVQ